MEEKSQEQRVQELIMEAARLRESKGPEASRQFLVDAATRMFASAVPKPPEPVPEPPRPAAPPPTTQVSDVEAGKAFVDLVREQLPGINTQAEYNAVVGAFGALRNTMVAILSGDKAQSANAESVLSATITAVRLAKGGSDKLRDVPEAATSEAAEAFKSAPKQFTEEATQKLLLEELAGLQDIEAFSAWYQATRDRREAVVTASLRNVLFDTIRARKLALS